ncbi:MAG: UPF0147 family protein [Thermoplasmata archaeon]
MDNTEDEKREIISLLDDLSGDQSLPRNIKKGAIEIKNKLLSKNEALDVKVAGAIFILEDLLNDPNIPVHGRTAVYTIIGKLEKLSNDISIK